MIFYLHIPKTGGQTLALRLASAFPPSRTHFMTDNMCYPEDAERLRTFRKTKDLVEAHVHGPLLQDSPDDVLCTVRDPIEQIISGYRHIAREPSNPLHTPAKVLAFADFFNHFGDHLANLQTRNLVNAFYEERPPQSQNQHRFLLQHFTDAMDRLRWLVPSEQIDEFTMLWSIENKRPVPSAATSVNLAPSDDERLPSWRAHLAKRSDLYDLDLAFWHAAKRRYSHYKEGVTQANSSPLGSDSAMCAYAMNGQSVLLTKGWHMPFRRSDNIREWWAGPSRFSESKSETNPKLRRFFRSRWHVFSASNTKTSISFTKATTLKLSDGFTSTLTLRFILFH
jgi:hypothetical protein